MAVRQVGIALKPNKPEAGAVVQELQRAGRIVNISSISAFLSDAGTSAYTMSKAAVEALEARFK